jgi:dTDP-4-amino-4,6-dideoxygalactose transaminase
VILRYQPASLLRLLKAAPSETEDWWRALRVDKPVTARVTASASDGIRLALLLIGGSGRVVAPAYTCDRVIAAIRSAGDQPILVDVDPVSGSCVREHVVDALSSQPKAILLTHLFGIDEDAPWLIGSASARGVPVIEDTSLILDLRGHADPKPAFSVFSFGRGKPLGLGGGGALLARDPLLANRLQKAVITHIEQSRFGLARLTMGAVRDGPLALWLASLGARSRGPATQHAPNKHLIEPFEPMTPSLKAARTIASLIRRTDTSSLERATQSALACYLDAFEANSIPCTSRVGRRLPPGTVSPVLALLSEERDLLLSELSNLGIDCPRYWNYSVAERMGFSGFFGAKKLSQSLMFLPLHRQINSKVADRIARLLSGREISTFS